jgi:hypothetical protein
MKAVKRVLRRAIVNEFYKANAGFFLVVLGLGFGFLKAPQHIDIASVIAMRPIFYLCPLGLWLVYITKTMAFVFRIKKLPENTWLSYLDLMPSSERTITIIHLQALLLAPILAYGSFLAFMAYQLEQWFSVSLVIFAHVILLMISAHTVDRKLVSAVDAKGQSSFQNVIQYLPKVFPMLFIHQLIGRQAILLLGIKLASMAIVIGAVFIYQMESTDLRIMSLGLLLSSAVNAALCFHYHEFEQNQLMLFKNTSISKAKKFIWFSTTYLILMLPEIAILLGNLSLHVDWIFLLKAPLLPFSLLVFFHHLFYLKQMSMEGFTKYIFFATVILFFVILGHFDPSIIAFTLLLASYFILQISGQHSKTVES